MSASISTEKIAIGSDHGGFALKKHLRGFLEQRGWRVEDCGTFSEEAVDYPRIAHAVAQRVASGRCGRGIIIDGAGIGSAMAANKVRGIRAALCYDVSSARNSREHNNANVLTLGARLIGPGLAEQIVETWLATDCTEERHLRRAAMIEEVPEGVAAAAPPPDGTGMTTPESHCACDARSPAGDAQLSDADLQRIVERIGSLITAARPGSGDPYADLACLLCEHCAETNPELVRRFIGLGADRIGHRPGAGDIPADIAHYIDHTLLRPDATKADIVRLCEEALKFGFASVCINPNWVTTAAALLKGSPVRVCTVAGFPLGAHVPDIKALEARRALREGATEIDMVINVGALKGGDDDLVRRDIAGIVEACRERRAVCKVIIETALLTDEEKVRACRLAKRARADFVKTSTGFGPGGATAHDVALMSETVRAAGMGVKASGGIRSFADARKMIEAGATRIGASAGIRIVQEATGVTVSA